MFTKESKQLSSVKDHYEHVKNIDLRIKLMSEGPVSFVVRNNLKTIVSLLAPYSSHERILDIGCGWGALCFFIPHYTNNYGIDISISVLKINYYKNKHFMFILSDAQKTCFKDACFDKFFCINLTGHVPYVKSLLSEAYRIVRPGGLGVVNFLNVFGIINIPRTLFHLNIGYYGKYNLFAPIDKSFEYFQTKKILKDIGFEVLGSFGSEFTLPFEIAKKHSQIANHLTQITEVMGRNTVGKLLSPSIIFKVRRPT